MQSSPLRSVEIDLLRVAAIGMMMVYHLAFDLEFYYGFPIDVTSGGWWFLEKVTANLFLLLVGISFVLSWSRTPSWKKYLRRGATIFCYGLVVSIATYIFDPHTFVRFGILHCIGVSMMLLPLFARLKWWNLILGMIIIALGAYVEHQTVDTLWHLPIGLKPIDFVSVDYFPLAPSFGFILIGTLLGHLFLKYRHLLHEIDPNTKPARAISAISQRSLLIYMVHQPLILLVLHSIF
jgi:uncharacterized membrane protein